MYQLMPPPWADTHIRRLRDGAIIPFDPLNRDYVEYLEWSKGGNSPQPDDAQPPPPPP